MPMIMLIYILTKSKTLTPRPDQVIRLRYILNPIVTIAGGIVEKNK